MKKTLFVLIILPLATPAMAAVSLTCTDDSNDFHFIVTIGYTGADPNNPVRAFALDVSTDVVNTPDITGCTALDPNYYIYPGTINCSDPNNIIWGSPVAPNTAPGASGTGINTRRIIIEMASLYKGAPNAPATSGDLFQIQTDPSVCMFTVTVVPEASTRGGIVLEDGNTVDVNIRCQIPSPNGNGCSPCECFPCADPNYSIWVANGKPSCWCSNCFRCGDSNHDCAITFIPDAKIIIDNWGGYHPCADYNQDGALTFIGDASAIINNWTPQCTACGFCTPW